MSFVTEFDLFLLKTLDEELEKERICAIKSEQQKQLSEKQCAKDYEAEIHKQKTILKKQIYNMEIECWNAATTYKDKDKEKDNVIIQQFVQLFNHFHRLVLEDDCSSNTSRTLNEIKHFHHQCAAIIDAIKKEIDFIERDALVDAMYKEINFTLANKYNFVGRREK